MALLEITWPEPAPNWTEAKRSWKWGWKFHVYAFALLYIFVALYAVFSTIRQRTLYQTRLKVHVRFLNILLLIFSFKRATILLWNPYGSEEESSPVLVVLSLILNGTATSCLTSAFSVLLLIILDTTKLSLAPPRFQRFGFLVSIWISNVVFLLISDLVVAHFDSAKVMIFVCQVLYALWGLVVAIGYAAAAISIQKNLRSSRETSRSNTNNRSRETGKMSRLLTMLCVASGEGIVLFIVSLYIASNDINNVVNEGGLVNIWPWFALQTTLRLLELSMCAIIFLVALRSRSHGRKGAVNVLPSSVALQTFNRTVELRATEN